MLTIEEIRERLKDRNLRAVSEFTGVNYAALCNIYKGASNPSYRTLKTLSDYLTQRAA
jgi:transcriptional regulator with XRE-family HTH domain